MILGTLLNINFSREYVQGFREILTEKLPKNIFYCIKVYVGKMLYLQNNECIRLSFARHYKVFEAFYKLINFPWTFHIRIMLTLFHILTKSNGFTDSLLTEYLIVVVKILYITLYFLMLDWHAFIVALHCCHFCHCKKYHLFSCAW